MSDLAVRVENLSKQFTIGATQSRSDTFRDWLVDGVNGLFRRHRSSKANNTFWALKDVSFEIRRGEVVGVIGRNGAGKSTLLKILARITEPTAGFAEVYGPVGSLLEVGTGFHGELTGRENIYLNGAILGMKKAQIQRQFDDIVSFAEVEQFLDTPVKHYSSGMYLRLAFAVAAHLDPDILIVDEVLAVGDANFQKKCLAKMEEVGKGGRTVIVVSHNLPVIANLCQRAILLSRGNVAMTGPADEVIHFYHNEAHQTPEAVLAERTDRAGANELIVREIEFLDQDEKPVQYPMSGQTLIIRVHYQSRVNKVFDDCRVLVAINKDDIVCCVLSTELVDDRKFSLAGRGYVDFVIPELPLVGGNYQLSAYLGNKGVGQDWITDAAQLSVMDGDFYGTGKIYPHRGWRGKGMLVRHYWKLPASAAG